MCLVRHMCVRIHMCVGRHMCVSTRKGGDLPMKYEYWEVFEVFFEPPNGVGAVLEGSGRAGGFGVNLIRPGGVRGQYNEGFRVNLTCYETHEI